MNWAIIIIEAIVLIAAFTAMILIPLVKNPVWWIADYPEDIQEEYFKTHERIPAKFFTPTVLLKKGMALLIALALLLVVVWLAGAYNFWSALGVQAFSASANALGKTIHCRRASVGIRSHQMFPCMPLMSFSCSEVRSTGTMSPS